MASGNRKTTMAKLNRERRLRERRLDKQAKKDARKHTSLHEQGQPGDVPTGGNDQSSPAEPDGEPAFAPVVQSPIDV
jgi:hypothetical protein